MDLDIGFALHNMTLSGRRVPVLPEWTLPELPVHAVMASRLQSASVRAFVEFLAARLAL